MRENQHQFNRCSFSTPSQINCDVYFCPLSWTMSESLRKLPGGNVWDRSAVSSQWSFPKRSKTCKKLCGSGRTVTKWKCLLHSQRNWRRLMSRNWSGGLTQPGPTWKFYGVTLKKMCAWFRTHLFDSYLTPSFSCLLTWRPFFSRLCDMSYW